MTVSSAAIMAVVLAHPAWSDRAIPESDREASLRPVAEAIALAAHTPIEAAELLALAFHESHFSVAVAREGCRGLPDSACDSHKARGPWQLHEAACRRAYAFPTGTPESLVAEAQCALAQLRFHGRRCRDHALTPMIGAFAGYSGGGCHWAGASERVLTTRRMVAELEKAEAS